MAWLISELKWAKLWWEIQRKTRWNFLSNICFHVRSETSKNLDKKMSDFMEIETKIKSYCQSNFSFFYWFLFHNLSSDWMDLLLNFFQPSWHLIMRAWALLHETINSRKQTMLKSYIMTSIEGNTVCLYLSVRDSVSRQTLFSVISYIFYQKSGKVGGPE